MSGRKTKPKGGGRDLHDPVAKCPKLASITVQVDSVTPEDATRTGVAGVSAEILSGPTSAAPKKTSGAGLAQFANLTPGSYQVGITVEGGMTRFYDLVPPPAPQRKTAYASRDQLYVFELRHTWIGGRILWAGGAVAQGFAFKLKVKAMKSSGELDTEWAMQHEGKSEAKDYNEKYVPKGRYQLSVEGVSDAKWGADRIVVGEPIALTAIVSGVEAGTAGTLTIFDSRDLTNAVETLNATVAEGAGGKELKATWTPAKDKLSGLKGSEAVFEAKAGTSMGYSPAVPVTLKENFEVVDPKAKKLDGHLSLYFSGGTTVEADAAGGEANVFAPWGQALARIEFGAKPCAVTLEEDGAAARGFLLSP